MTIQSYPIKTIKRKNEIQSNFPFQVKHFYWNSMVKPTSSCNIALLQDKGIFIIMNAEESSVPAKYKQHQDPVYLDSAMEFFIGIPRDNLIDSYFNIEINSNGAVLAQFGPNRNHRHPLSLDDIKQMEVMINCSSINWTVSFILPFSIIKKYNKDINLPFHFFRFNFYKICEDDSYRHFGSFSPLSSLTPNFHLPQFFAIGTL